jgi:hypothetical protein
MNRMLLAGLALAALGAACDRAGPPASSISKGHVEQLAAANATVVGYLFKPGEPYLVASFQDGSLHIRTDPKSTAAVQGRAEVFTWADRSCMGFQQKNLLMPNHGPQKYLVCEALQSIQHYNSLPRGQDFRFDRGALFVMYEPPKGTGDVQLFYAAPSK